MPLIISDQLDIGHRRFESHHTDYHFISDTATTAVKSGGEHGDDGDDPDTSKNAFRCLCFVLLGKSKKDNYPSTPDTNQHTAPSSTRHHQPNLRVFASIVMLVVAALSTRLEP